MTDVKKPFEHPHLTDVQMLEVMKQLDLPEDAYVLATDPVLAANVRTIILCHIGREEIILSTEKERQARVYWEIGIGRVLGFPTFEDYRATVPDPEPNPSPSHYDRLVLIDRRLGLAQLAQMFRIGFHLTMESVDNVWREYPTVEFIWCQDGRRNRGRDVRECLATLREGEMAMTAVEGLCLHAQVPTILLQPDTFVVDLPGTYSLGYPNRTTHLRRVGDVTELEWFRVDGALTQYGTATRAR